MHAELLARRVPGAEVTAVHDAHAADAPRRRRRARRAASARRRGAARRAPTSTRSRSARSTDTHADLIVAAARAARRSSARSRSRSTSPRSTARWRRSRPPACRSRSASTAASTPRTRPWHDAVAGGEVGEPQLVRISSRDPAPPPLAYVRVSGGIFLDMTIHDFDMARYVTGSEVVEVFARGAVRVDPAFGEAGDVDTARRHARARERLPDAIDNSRQAVYGYDQRVEVFGSAGMAASENPLAHSAVVRTADGHAAADAAVLLPRALHPELPARVGGVRRRGRRAAARRRSTGRRRPRAARDRARGVAVAARGPAGRRRRSRRWLA